MKSEFDEATILEMERFKMMMVAQNPGQAKEIIAALDSTEEVAQPQVELTDQGFNDEERGWIIDQLRGMGYSVSDD